MFVCAARVCTGITSISSYQKSRPKVLTVEALPANCVCVFSSLPHLLCTLTCPLSNQAELRASVFLALEEQEAQQVYRRPHTLPL